MKKKDLKLYLYNFRQYYLCIGGIPREYGCPLGAVFNVGSGNGVDGECSDPELVPECRDYYGDEQFDPRELSSNGFNSRNKVGSKHEPSKDYAALL